MCFWEVSEELIIFENPKDRSKMFMISAFK